MTMWTYTHKDALGLYHQFDSKEKDKHKAAHGIYEQVRGSGFETPIIEILYGMVECVDMEDVNG